MLVGFFNNNHACTPATAKPVLTNEAINMCKACGIHASLNMAATGSILVKTPSTTSKPVGLFIHPLAAMTKSPDISPAIPTTIPDSKCRRGESMFQP